MAAAGGCDSRSSSASVRSVRASRIGAGSCSDRSCTRARVDRDAAARAARRRRDRAARDAPTSGSISRPSTNDSGSSPSIGHSRSSACSKRSSGTAGTSGAASSPRASRCHSHAGLPETRRHVVGRQRRELAERAQAPAAECATIASSVVRDFASRWSHRRRDSAIVSKQRERQAGERCRFGRRARRP